MPNILNIELKIWLFLTIIIIIVFLWYFIWINFFNIIDFFKAIYNKIEFKKNLERIKKDILDKKPKIKKFKEEVKQKESPKVTKKREIIIVKMEKLKFSALAFKEKWDIDKYEQKLIEWLSMDPLNLEFTRLLADLYFSIWTHKKALPLLKRILEQDTMDHKAIWQIWQIYFEKWDLDTSKLLIEKALKLKNDNPKYFMTMAEIFYSKEQINEAIENMEQALRLRPSNINYLLWIASLYEEICNYDEAKKYYFKVLELDPINTLAKEKLNSL
mgnify:CR=1 FL=1